VLKYIDMASNPTMDSNSLDRYVGKASIHGYTVLAIEGLDSYKVFNGVQLIPRISFKFNELGKEVLMKRECIKILRSDSLEDLKITNAVKKVAHAIELGHELLRSMDRKALKKLVNAGKPVIINLRDVIRLINLNAPVLGLLLLLRYYERGRISLVVGSGAREEHELLHPITICSFLVSLGLSEAKALSSISINPLSVMRSAGYDVLR